MVPSARRRSSSAAFAACLLLAACSGAADDPALDALRKSLSRGERLLQMRILEPASEGAIAAVVQPAGKEPELRIHERDRSGDSVVRCRSRLGDTLRVLEAEDLDGDGREEVLATWIGGHLEILEILKREADGSCRTLFQDGGQAVVRRLGPGGATEIRVTSRTYDEEAGQPPVYDTTIYRWTGDAFESAGPPAPGGAPRDPAP